MTAIPLLCCSADSNTFRAAKSKAQVLPPPRQGVDGVPRIGTRHLAHFPRVLIQCACQLSLLCVAALREVRLRAHHVHRCRQRLLARQCRCSHCTNRRTSAVVERDTMIVFSRSSPMLLIPVALLLAWTQHSYPAEVVHNVPNTLDMRDSTENICVAHVKRPLNSTQFAIADIRKRIGDHLFVPVAKSNDDNPPDEYQIELSKNYLHAGFGI